MNSFTILLTAIKETLLEGEQEIRNFHADQDIVDDTQLADRMHRAADQLDAIILQALQIK